MSSSLPKYNGISTSPKANGIETCDHSASSEVEVYANFHDSIRKDYEGIKYVAEGLDSNEVNRFLDLIDECEGHLVLSGIGKLNILGYWQSCIH